LMSMRMQLGWLSLKVFLGRNVFAFDLRDYVFKTRYALALEQACDACLGDVWIDVLPGDEKQIVEGR